MREYTNKILDLAKEGYFDHADGMYELVCQLLMWLPESDVKEFWFANGFHELFDGEE